MHVLVVYAVYQMHLGATLDLKWMTAINEGLEQCSDDQAWASQLVDAYFKY